MESPGSSDSADKPKSKLESLSREELLIFVKKQAVALRDLKVEVKRMQEGQHDICQGKALSVSRDCQTDELLLCDQQQTLTEQERQVETLRSLLAVRTLDLEASRVELSKLKSELDRLTQPQSQEGQDAILRMEIDEYRQSIKKLQEDIRQLGDLYAEKNDQLKQADRAHKDLSQEVQKSKVNIDSLEKQVVQLQQDNCRLSEQLQKAREEMKLSDEAFAQFRHESQREKLHLTEELTSSHGVLEAANSVAKDLKHKVADLEVERDQLRAELNSINEEFEAYKVRSQAVLKQKNLVNPPQWVEQEAQERELLEEQLRIAQGRLADLSRSYDDALVQIKELSETGVDTKERLESTIRKAEEVENALRSKLEHFSKQSVEAVRALEQKLQESNEQLESAKRDLQDQLRMKDENHATEKAILEQKLQALQTNLKSGGLSVQRRGSTPDDAEVPVNETAAEVNGTMNAMVCSRCGEWSSCLKEPLFVQVVPAAEDM
uniref:Golgin subfamily A conserved domain-containing protein n=1 Tax=Trichuris muris TaxID=70415 RepID=A0A5S6Q3Y8_TRIMR